MMESSSNIFSIENGDENGLPHSQQNVNSSNWGPQKPHPSTSYSSKTPPVSFQQMQRRPFQTLNTNTSSVGAIGNEILYRSSNTTKKVSHRFRVSIANFEFFCCPKKFTSRDDIFTDFIGVVRFLAHYFKSEYVTL